MRTQNMKLMVVTLDVSRLSGWLNADAPCRVEGVLHDVGQGAGKETGGAWGEGCARSLQGKARLGAWHARAHRKHAEHACDAGGVETKRLVKC